MLMSSKFGYTSIQHLFTSLGSSLIIFSHFYFFRFLVKNDSLGNLDFVWQRHLDYPLDSEGFDQERQLVQITLMYYK